MSSRWFKKVLIAVLVVATVGTSFYCGNKGQGRAEEPHPGTPWRNVYDTTARYVGMETCRGCHQEVYNTFIQTGMGQSFDRATHTKSAADFSPAHALVYDSTLDFYYHPYWDGDTLTILEYRLKGTDTVHKRVQRVNYIVGSGQHTNSHIFSVNGYLYQAPITFYTQQHRWDLAPGFEKGASTRFQRLIQLECMSCHNGYPEFTAGSENKFTVLKNGIDCERCHGPGSIHVAERGSQPRVDTSKGPDYSIVNPRRLSTELQNNVCQRCHLQGIAVLNDGKSFFDFRPGMHLSEVMNVFMPQYEGPKDKMIMASHVERMKRSNCYISSGKMSCITCHNPHVSVKFTPRSQYLSACNGCHASAGTTACTQPLAQRQKAGNDCITCHMPRNGSIDIPHVAVTDHYIRRNPAADTAIKAITAFIGMTCYNNDHPDAITTARAFLEFYERYAPSPGLLDSALTYLGKGSEEEATGKQNKDLIRVYFLKRDFPKVVQLATHLKPAEVKDAWAAYRVGEAFMETGQPGDALAWYGQAKLLWPYSLDFQNKYGVCLLALNRIPEAKKVFEWILSENNQHIGANTNLGFIAMQSKNAALAFSYLRKAQQLDPDYEQNLLNLAVYYYSEKDYRNAEIQLMHLLDKHPANEQAKAMLIDLQKYL